jgi:hypothetical protein
VKPLKYSEPVTTIACALSGVEPIATALAGGAAKLASLFSEHGARHGFDSQALIEKMQDAAFRAADRYDKDQDWRDALTEAHAGGDAR